MLNNKSILITGGTGSFGKAFVKAVLQKYPDVKRLVIFSRDEQKQFQMEMEYPHQKFPQVRFFIGDVRDEDRIRMALKGIDTVVHAAAMKHIHIAEYNPMECIKTNIIGAENLIKACLDSDVENVVALSTDKAAAPINLYGATKLASDKLFIAANNIKGTKKIKFSVVRYGNVMGSNGSVIPFFLKKRKEKVLPITDPSMTRFNILLEEAVDMVFYALDNAWGGELFVPKIPSFKITDLAEAIGPDCKQNIVGIRPGEKLHEEMITSSDSFSTYDMGKYYVILPQSPNWNVRDYLSHFKSEKVPAGFNYTSGNNDSWLSVEDLRKLIHLHVDPSFEPQQK
ncbi:MAG: UDP-N-acetylglucosamine 4,6-dehydratase (inverting) [Bacteroidetes bacterium]|nr:UDP-N-acetylglucosamine 4,6-dehydratase (inverting) [Bacteroidota bacterium]MBK9525489.1 UDP-N-acetylglucosamine 4,6-dehydratase (inverting) [Bacteroidota bacterium]MBP6402842.1 UDP-N-acetylglucosamine 4,6-dehydratase (inverting) [Bacteroidia bacterium]MBP6648708.1 UDP-N-acetylglucosamine 4,6-dehydratase (inverting) [Bacteroidia bacterium]